MIPKSRDDALIAIKTCAQATGDRFDLTACAIACALHEDPDREIGHVLDVLGSITARVHDKIPNSPQSFVQLVYGDLGFGGNGCDYDDPASADLLKILLTRKGLPIGIGHVWRLVARIANLPLYGTDTPGHFIMRYETDTGPVFLDPYEGGAILDGDNLADLARRAGRESFTDPMMRAVSDRVMAVRLQTNLVSRARASGDIEAWVRGAQRRAILAPDNHQVALDYSQAAEAAGQLKVALQWSQRARALQSGTTSSLLAQSDIRSQTLKHMLN